MKFSELTEAVFIAASRGVVPVIMGHTGVGKSTLIENVAKLAVQKGYSEEIPIITIFGSLLKEGELGGMPIPVERDGILCNDYTTHISLKKIIDYDKKGLNTILFIDEINRTSKEVNQELMQLILSRKINMTKLPDSCMIIAAGNPDSSDSQNLDYQVNYLNPAFWNRVVEYTLDADVSEWLRWASNTFDSDNTDAIAPDVINFIATYPEHLLNVRSQEEKFPTPRGWDLFSKIYRGILSDDFSTNKDDLIYQTGLGIVGRTPIQTFVSFLRDKSNPLITVKEIFESPKNDFFNKILENFKQNSVIRQNLIIDRCIKYLNKNVITNQKKTKEMKGNKNEENELTRFIILCENLPKDYLLGVIKFIVNHEDNKALFEKLQKYERFLNLYFDTQKRIVS